MGKIILQQYGERHEKWIETRTKLELRCFPTFTIIHYEGWKVELHTGQVQDTYKNAEAFKNICYGHLIKHKFCIYHPQQVFILLMFKDQENQRINSIPALTACYFFCFVEQFWLLPECHYSQIKIFMLSLFSFNFFDD